MTREKITQTCQQWLESRLWWWRACPPAALEIWPLSLWHKAAKCLWLQEKLRHCIETGTWCPQKASVLGRNDRWWLVWLDDVCIKLNKYPSTNCYDVSPEPDLNSALFFLTFLTLSLHFWFWAFHGGGARRWDRVCGLPFLFLWLCDLTLLRFTVPLRVITPSRALFLLPFFWLGFLHFLLCSTPIITVWAVFLLLPLWRRFVTLVFRRVFSTRSHVWTERPSLQFSWFCGPLSRLLFDQVNLFLFHLYLIKYEFLPSDSQ